MKHLRATIVGNSGSRKETLRLQDALVRARIRASDPLSPPFRTLTVPNPIEALTEEIVAFRDARDWKQFHNPKDLALALSIEAAELNERFLWKTPEHVGPSEVREELADVLIYALLIAHHYGLAVEDIVRDKLEVNAKRYPEELSRGSARKYDEL